MYGLITAIQLTTNRTLNILPPTLEVTLLADGLIALTLKLG
jgi:hypothetical protein